MGAKSIIANSLIGGVTFGNSDRQCAIGVGGPIEDDSLANSVIGAACTLSDPRLKVTANSITSDLDFELYKNGVATSCTVTVLASGNPTGWVTGTGTVDVAAGDNVQWRSGIDAGGSVDISHSQILCESDNATAITPFLLNNSGSSNLTDASTTYYFKICGNRSSQTDETRVLLQLPVGGEFSYLWFSMGVVARTTTCTGRLRIDQVDGSQSVTWDNTIGGDFLETDSSNSDTYTANDDLSLSVTNGTGTGANNIEKAGVSFTNTNGDFCLIVADDYRETQLDDVTRYYAVSGALSAAFSATESDVSFVAPFDFNVSELFMRIVSITGAVTGTLSLMRNGSAVGTDFEFGGSGYGAGHNSEAQDVGFSAGDTFSFRVITDLGGTNIRIGHIGLVAREASAAASTILPQMLQHNHFGALQ